MTIGLALATIGLITCIAFGYFMLCLAYNEIKKDVEYKPLPDVNDLPQWEKLNTVGLMANEELKKMYKGKMRGDLV